MIGSIKGKIINKKPTKLLIDVSGVGYVVNISINTLEKIGDAEDVFLYTYLNVREDALELYGFSSLNEKEMFETLISVNGIGPKLAQSILSGIMVDDLKLSIKSGDLGRLISIPGIGRKTAERMVIELRDKVDSVYSEKGAPKEYHLQKDAVNALVNLGYNLKISEKVVHDIITKTPKISVEELIKIALSQLNK